MAALAISATVKEVPRTNQHVFSVFVEQVDASADVFCHKREATTLLQRAVQAKQECVFQTSLLGMRLGHVPTRTRAQSCLAALSPPLMCCFHRPTVACFITFTFG